MFLGETTRAVNCLRSEVLRPVSEQEVGIVQKSELLERFAALDLSKHVSKGRSQGSRIHFVENDSHLRVAGNPIDVKQLLHVFIVASSVKGEQRRVFQCEER